MTGGTPRTMGVSYDLAYDRALNPPMNTNGNGLLGGSCTKGSPSGTTTEYEEAIDFDQSLLNGGALVGDGGVDSIDKTRLERDNNCDPVFPWHFVRVNTIYGVIHHAGGYTAWADKHPSYSSVGGPTGTNTDTNVDDYFAPEINSDSGNFLNVGTGAFPALIPDTTLVPAGCNPLPDSPPPSPGMTIRGAS
jgi:hypothetical protein